jgi:hypothetical protein
MFIVKKQISGDWFVAVEMTCWHTSQASGPVEKVCSHVFAAALLLLSEAVL